MQFLTKIKYSIALVFAVVLGFSILNGCDDSGITKTDPVDTNVAHFDSIWVEEDSSVGSFNGINLLNVVNSIGGYALRDASVYGG